MRTYPDAQFKCKLNFKHVVERQGEAYRKKVLELHPAYVSLCIFSTFLSQEKSCGKELLERIILFHENIQVSRKVLNDFLNPSLWR